MARPCHRVLSLWSQGEQKASNIRTEDVQRRLSALRTRKDNLLNVHLDGEIDKVEFSAKNMDLKDRIAHYTLQLEAADRSSDEHADLARKAFELSQSLPERWVTADTR